MKNETMPLYVSRRNAYVHGVCHDNIAFYMLLPTKIDRAPFRHGDQNHITMVRVAISTREIGYAKQMKRHFSRRIAKIWCEKPTLSPEVANALYKCFRVN